MLLQHYQTPAPGDDYAALVANPRQFILETFERALARWQPVAEVQTGPVADPDKLHDVAASAAFLGVVPQTVHAYVKEKILSPLRLRPGGKLYFKRGDLLAALKRNDCNPATDKRRKANKKA